MKDYDIQTATASCVLPTMVWKV